MPDVKSIRNFFFLSFFLYISIDTKSLDFQLIMKVFLKYLLEELYISILNANECNSLWREIIAFIVLYVFCAFPLDP